MSLLHCSYILAEMRYIDIITLTTVNNWTTALSCNVILHILFEKYNICSKT
jgi:hypothetical protein